MTTPEEIEGIQSTDYKRILKLCNELHAGTVRVLDILTPKDVEEQELLRKRTISKLDEACSSISAEMADLEALKRELRIKRSYQTSDRDRLQSHRIGIYVAEKELRNFPS